MMKLIYAIFFLLIIIACEQEFKTAPINKMEDICVPLTRIDAEDTTTVDIYYKGLQEYGWAEAIKVNKKWEASARAYFDREGLNVDIRTYVSEEKPQYLLERLIFSGIPLETFCNNLASDRETSVVRTTFYAMDGGDVVEDGYSIDTLYGNKLEITELDTTNNKVAGNFITYFFNNRRWTGRPWNPDSLSFFNGRFEAEIIEF